MTPRRAGRRRGATDVLLVSMPFGNVLAPSIGLSLLKAGLTRAGVGCRVRYFTIPFAERVGERFYRGVADDREPSVRELPGEWIFAGSLFGATPRQERAYVREVLRERTGWIGSRGVPPASPALIARIRRARRLADGFLDWCLEEVLDERPRLVGFTSVKPPGKKPPRKGPKRPPRKPKKAPPQTF